ncbi:KamA family radical SAM protein [Methanoculleus oceani]|uniref:KamA family radical SAM protein n=1 Tax=Methanoculleus oceani TaxID=2184756 RepID=A0ABD4TH83_9EURY|nr:KamA family radical SAM protein [Methanoculleus sp. CWC-02]MCM2466294.1 KamA family radical SAM protein [Methanoculleus sp. CWC-02]
MNTTYDIRNSLDDIVSPINDTTNPIYLSSLDRVPGISPEERARLAQVTDLFAFRANDYYLSLIDWNDPADPIRRLVIPTLEELVPWGHLDPSSEHRYTRAPGLQHKYRETALLLVSDLCGGLCRYCFRKRLFIEDAREVNKDISRGLAYIRDHPEINNVLLTGGDPLILETGRLLDIIRQLRDIDHVEIIRIGTKMPAYDPFRITNDLALLDMIRDYSLDEKRIYIMAQFNHPRELTDAACRAVALLQDAGAVVMNQTPLIRGINDDPEVLASLFDKLSFIGANPYYVFQCRPTIGNRPFAVPVEESYRIFEQARSICSGLAKRARFVISHATGKIEVLGKTDKYTYFKYNQAANPDDRGRFMVYKSNPDAYWFDDYTELVDEGRVRGPDGLV